MNAMRSRVVAGLSTLAVLVGWVVPAPAAGQAAVTYDDVAPLLSENCVRCHRPGGLGPFSLASYDGARARAERIVEMVAARRMPPWQPARDYGASAFEGEPRLSGADVDLLRRWAAAGAPAGSGRAAAPELPRRRLAARRAGPRRFDARCLHRGGGRRRRVPQLRPAGGDRRASLGARRRPPNGPGGAGGPAARPGDAGRHRHREPASGGAGGPGLSRPRPRPRPFPARRFPRLGRRAPDRFGRGEPRVAARPGHRPPGAARPPVARTAGRRTGLHRPVLRGRSAGAPSAGRDTRRTGARHPGRRACARRRGPLHPARRGRRDRRLRLPAPSGNGGRGHGRGSRSSRSGPAAHRRLALRLAGRLPLCGAGAPARRDPAASAVQLRQFRRASARPDEPAGPRAVHPGRQLRAGRGVPAGRSGRPRRRSGARPDPEPEAGPQRPARPAGDAARGPGRLPEPHRPGGPLPHPRPARAGPAAPGPGAGPGPRARDGPLQPGLAARSRGRYGRRHRRVPRGGRPAAAVRRRAQQPGRPARRHGLTGRRDRLLPARAAVRTARCQRPLQPGERTALDGRHRGGDKPLPRGAHPSRPTTRTCTPISHAPSSPPTISPTGSPTTGAPST